MAETTLYHYLMSVCSMKTRLGLAEMNVPYHSREVDIGFALENFEPWYVKLNQRAVVPTLQDDSTVVNDSAKILHYAAAKWRPAMLGEGSHRKIVEDWVGSGDGVNLQVITYAFKGVPRGAELLEARLARSLEYQAKYPELADTYAAIHRRIQNHKSSAAAKPDVAKALAELDSVLGRMNSHLEGSPFIGGKSYSIADVIWTVILARLHLLKKPEVSPDKFSHIAGYYQRMTERPSFAAAKVQPVWVGGI
jgi:tetrachloro-p-hydroquinone reductive dehalogenase